MESIKNIEKILKGLANRRRLSIIKYLLNEEEATVANIAENINLSFKATSKHLLILRQLDIIDSRQQSLSVFYRVSDTLPRIVKDISKYISNSRE